MISRKTTTLFIVFFILFANSGCQSQWKIDILSTGTNIDSLTKNDITFYIDKSVEPIQTIPLGQLLYASGFTLVEDITLHHKDDQEATYVWKEIAEQSTISETGEVIISGESWYPSAIDVTPSPLSKDITYSVMDISPTVAQALGLPDLPDATGKSRITDITQWDHAVMILMDGVQFDILLTMLHEGALPFLGNQDQIYQGLSVYPPITTSASAAILTGTPPIKNGVFGYGYRSTEQTTLFDLAASHGKSVIAVEGSSIPFNLRNAETILSGDKDGNGFSDDNVFMNSIEIIQTNMPDLLYIHFHEVDDMGHTYGPDSLEYRSALISVDHYLSHIFNTLPSSTFVAIFADHGMHTTIDGGNHGTLLPDDLLIPIIFSEK
jgi:hypothetical protein